MDTVKSVYYRLCDAQYSHLSFKRVKSTYVCIYNNMLQTFTLEKANSHPWYNVHFGIIPLCNTILSLDIGLYSLAHFYPDVSIFSNGWALDHSGVSSSSACALKIVNAVEQHLIPLFLKCNNCNVALNELIKLEETLDNNRKMVLQQEGRCDCAESWQITSLHDPNKYYLALKAKNYDYMYRYLEHKMLYYDKIINDIVNGTSQQPEIVYQNFVADCENIRKQLTKLDMKDINYFDELAFKKEQQTIRHLKGKYPMLFMS